MFSRPHLRPYHLIDHEKNIAAKFQRIHNQELKHNKSRLWSEISQQELFEKKYPSIEDQKYPIEGVDNKSTSKIYLDKENKEEQWHLTNG